MCILYANVTHPKLKLRKFFPKNSYSLHHEHYVMNFDGCKCAEITVKEKSNVNTHKL